MGTKQVLVCDVCGKDHPEADRKLRVSVRDATNPHDEKEQPGAVEACAACLPTAAGGAMERARAMALEVRPGLVSSFAVRIDVIPLRATAVPPPPAPPGDPPTSTDWRDKLRAKG